MDIKNRIWREMVRVDECFDEIKQEEFIHFKCLKVKSDLVELEEVELIMKKIKLNLLNKLLSQFDKIDYRQLHMFGKILRDEINNIKGE